jgi:hypothetical protein
MEQAPDPTEANEADVAEQQTPAEGWTDDEDPTELSPEANEADALEQRATVPDDELEEVEDDEAHPRDGG